LGGTTSRGYGINASGQVTGWAFTSSGVEHAFLYSNGVMVDLNSEIGSSTGYTLVSGEAINDSGQIVVNGSVTATGQDLALLLTPTS
jgi:probable HAF family extracellular repeat protein